MIQGHPALGAAVCLSLVLPPAAQHAVHLQCLLVLLLVWVGGCTEQQVGACAIGALLSAGRTTRAACALGLAASSTPTSACRCL